MLYGLKQIELSTLSQGVYAVIFGLGTIRGSITHLQHHSNLFLIPQEIYANGATWTTIGWQSRVIIGPMLDWVYAGIFSPVKPVSSVWR